MSTIREVAALAKVSPATVSRVLNCDTTYKITDETKERVWKAAAELNYKIVIKGRKTSREEKQDKANVKIACILNTMEKQLGDPYFMAILSDFEEHLQELGYYISVITTGKELRDKMQSEKKMENYYDGILLMENMPQEYFDIIRNSSRHVVGIDTSHREIDNVGYDHYKASDIALRYLYEKGYRKIGFIAGSKGDKIDARALYGSSRYKGFYASAHYLGIELEEKWIIDCHWSEESCIEQVSKLCQENDLPEAFYVASDVMALATMGALHSYGIEIPSQISIVGLSDIKMAKYCNPPLTTVGIPMREIGKTAAEVMVERIQGRQGIPLRYVTPCSLVERESTKTLTEK